MATHSSVLAWRIPGMAEPGGLPSMGRTELDMTEVTLIYYRSFINEMHHYIFLLLHFSVEI